MTQYVRVPGICARYFDKVTWQFRFKRLRFSFRAVDRLQFATDVPANTLRGALGEALRRHPEQYERVFAPKRLTGPSGFRDAPRPFVFRARQLNGLVVNPGDPFAFEVHVFDPGIVHWLSGAFAQVTAAGLGANRSRIELESVEEKSCAVDLSYSSAHSLRVDFLTPTELKTAGHVAAEPDFVPLLARARDRVSELSFSYGDGVLPIGFAELGERAAAVKMTACECAPVFASRVSSRTGQSHSLGGFAGWASYAGDLGEFVPILIAAQFTGVGRQTTWGKGEIQVHAHS